MADELSAGVAGDNPSFAADLDSSFSEEPTTDEVIEDDPEPVEEIEKPAPVEQVLESEPEVEEVEQPIAAKPEGEDRVVERDGKKEYRLNESRYGLFTENLNLRRELEQRLVPDSEDGKPITVEDIRSQIDIGQKARIGAQEMDLDFISGDPAAHQKLVDFFIKTGQAAVESGDVATDPFVPFARNFFATIAERHPGAYAAIQGQAASTLLSDLYELASEQIAQGIEKAEGLPPEAAKKIIEASKNLLYSAQHIDKQLFNRYRKEDGTPVNVSPEKRAAPIQRAAAPVPRRETAGQQQFENFRVKADTDSKSAIHAAVETSLADIKKAYDKAGLPETYGAILDRLNSVVQKELKGDAEWQSQIRIELRHAQLSPSEQKRQEIGSRIVRRHATRAQQIISKHIGPITAEVGKATNVRLNATHERRAAAQEKRAPGGGGPPAKSSLIPTRNADWNPNNFGKEIDALLG